MIATAKEGQSLVDVALMMTGGVEGVWALALRNGLGVTDALGHGTEIAYESEDTVDARTAARYAAEGISPATEVSDKTLDELLNMPKVVTRRPHELITADKVAAQSTRAAVFAGEFTAVFS